MPTASYTVEALYQPFERGFMVWRSDENCVYALVDTQARNAIIPEMPGNNSYAYCLNVAPLTGGNVISAPSTGLVVPTGVLGVVWAYYEEIEERLGYATQPETYYMATIPAVDDSPVQDGLPFTIPQMTLPNGHVLACGSRAAMAHTCTY